MKARKFLIEFPFENRMPDLFTLFSNYLEIKSLHYLVHCLGNSSHLHIFIVFKKKVEKSYVSSLFRVKDYRVKKLNLFKSFLYSKFDLFQNGYFRPNISSRNLKNERL